MKKEPVAGKVSKDIKEGIDKIVKESLFLNLTQSQVIEAILEMYFKAPHNHGDKIRAWVIEKRKKYIENIKITDKQSKRK